MTDLGRRIECTFDGRTLTVELVTASEDLQEFYVEGEFRPNRPKDQIWRAVGMSGLLKQWMETDVEIRCLGIPGDRKFALVKVQRLSGNGIPHFSI